MDLDFDDTQEQLRAMLRELLEQRHSTEVLRDLEDSPVGFSEDLWRDLAAYDLVGLTLPTEHGGSGMGAIETVVVYEELGRALATTPHLTTAVLGARLLADRPDWLARIAKGEVILTLAWYEANRSEDPAGMKVTAVEGRLSGTKVRVPLASSADAFLVVTRDGVFLVDAGSAGIELTQTLGLGSDAEYEVTFTDVAAELVADRATFDDAMTDVLIAVGAWAVGAAKRALEMTVEYAGEREQFGRKIGSFQGLAHPIADVATEVTAAEVMVHQAAWRRATGDEMGPLAHMAKGFACDVFKRVTRVGQQVFGGVGFTRALDIQLYFRRAKQLELTWYGPRYLEEVVAAAELDAERGFVSIDAGV